jgi:hypothetical protein
LLIAPLYAIIIIKDRYSANTAFIEGQGYFFGWIMAKIRKDFSFNRVVIFTLIGVFLWSNISYSNTLRVPFDTKHGRVKSVMGYDVLEQNPLWNNPLMQKLVGIAAPEFKEFIENFLLFPYKLSDETMKEIRRVKQETDLLGDIEKIEKGNGLLAENENFEDLIKMTISGKEVRDKSEGFIERIGSKTTFFDPMALKMWDNERKRDKIVRNFDWMYTAISVVCVLSKTETLRPTTLEKFLKRLYSGKEFENKPEKIHEAAHGFLQIYCDVSGTIADHPKGSHEEKLALIVSQDEKVVSVAEKKEFIEACKKGFDEFSNIRKKKDIPIGERYMAWLAPLKGKLHKRHIQQLVEDWQFKDEFLQGTRVIRKYLSSDYPIVITAESGALVNMIKTFIDTKAEEALKSENIVMLYDGVELVMDIDGYFQGEVRVHGNLFYATPDGYPAESLVIGDNPMVTYGFGPEPSKFGGVGKDILVNVEEFSLEDAERVVKKWYGQRQKQNSLLLLNNPLMQKLVDILESQRGVDCKEFIIDFLLFSYDLSDETMEELRRVKQETDSLDDKGKIEKGNRLLVETQENLARATFEELIEMTISGEEFREHGGGWVQLIADKMALLNPEVFKIYDNKKDRHKIVENFDLIYTAISVVYVLSKTKVIESITLERIEPAKNDI